jgi:DNA-binding NarL/FixJ family response regulator
VLVISCLTVKVTIKGFNEQPRCWARGDQGSWDVDMQIKLIVVDDHEIMREGLRSLFARHDDMIIVGEAEDGRKAVQLAQELKPDVVVMDVAMPQLNGIEATRAIAAENGPKVVVLSMHSEQQILTAVLEAGARGFVLKESAFGELALAVRAVHEGKFYLSPSIAEHVVKDYVRTTSQGPPAFRQLSSRERQVLQLLAEGKMTKEIAVILGVSPKTIEAHRHQIMTKLKIYSVAELTKYAVRENLTQL